jgi:hypothetical protein
MRFDDVGGIVRCCPWHAEYNARARTLIFNLKDSTNPGLRGRVLQGVLTPAQLCALSPVELARKDLIEVGPARYENQLRIRFQSTVVETVSVRPESPRIAQRSPKQAPE